jgi:hypothetical protein
MNDQIGNHTAAATTIDRAVSEQAGELTKNPRLGTMQGAQIWDYGMVHGIERSR